MLEEELGRQRRGRRQATVEDQQRLQEGTHGNSPYSENESFSVGGIRVERLLVLYFYSVVYLTYTLYGIRPIQRKKL